MKMYRENSKKDVDSRIEEWKLSIPEPKPEIVELSSTWSHVFKDPSVKNRHYPEEMHCYKCGKLIPDYTWFYSKRVGNRNQKTEYYCEKCFERLWV